MRPTFGLDYIAEEFQRIAGELSDPLAVYLIGGGAMALRDMKAATKDIDLVVADGDAYDRLWNILRDLGYSVVQSPGPEYRALGASACVENDDGCRLDLFNQQVVDTLVLTEGMAERSESFLATDHLTVRLVSNVDVFLFKLVAGRDDDIEDMNVLVQAGLDFEVIRIGLDAQIERLGDDRFATYTNEALVELEERYGVRTPLEDRVQELSSRYYDGLEVLQALDEPTRVDDLATELDLKPREVRDRVAYLARFGRVARDGETVRPLE